jgi:ketosteroid isomerase-like protein
MKKLNFMIILGLVLAAPTTAMADDADDVIALAKAQWAAQMANAPAAKVMEAVADDYTEFNPTYPTRLDGKKLNVKFAEVSAKDATKLVVAEMANSKVQVYGDVAILTYNFLGALQGPDGTINQFTAKSTRVYAKKGGDWMLVHANFAPVTNSPNN